MSEGVNVILQRLSNVEYKLQEAASELARHHADFEKISKICEDVNNNPSYAAEAISRIRNIVG